MEVEAIPTSDSVQVAPTSVTSQDIPTPNDASKPPIPVENLKTQQKMKPPRKTAADAQQPIKTVKRSPDSLESNIHTTPTNAEAVNVPIATNGNEGVVSESEPAAGAAEVEAKTVKGESSSKTHAKGNKTMPATEISNVAIVKEAVNENEENAGEKKDEIVDDDKEDGLGSPKSLKQSSKGLAKKNVTAAKRKGKGKASEKEDEKEEMKDQASTDADAAATNKLISELKAESSRRSVRERKQTEHYVATPKDSKGRRKDDDDGDENVNDDESVELEGVMNDEVESGLYSAGEDEVLKLRLEKLGSKSDQVVAIHRLMYKSAGNKFNAKKNIRMFTGLSVRVGKLNETEVVEENESIKEKTKEKVAKLQKSLLVEILDILNIDRSRKSMNLIDKTKEKDQEKVEEDKEETKMDANASTAMTKGALVDKLVEWLMQPCKNVSTTTPKKKLKSKKSSASTAKKSTKRKKQKEQSGSKKESSAIKRKAKTETPKSNKKSKSEKTQKEEESKLEKPDVDENKVTELSEIETKLKDKITAIVQKAAEDENMLDNLTLAAVKKQLIDEFGEEEVSKNNAYIKATALKSMTDVHS